jgi:tetratricopeptide (TPR) repeat protein
MDPGLEKAAKQIQQWHTDGVLGPDDRGVSLSPDVAFALAWFAPAEKGFIDNRLALFAKAAADYEEANKALMPDRERETLDSFNRRLGRVAQVLRQNNANHLIFHFADLVRDSDRYGRLFATFEADPTKQFTLVYRDGRTAILSWDDPEKKAPPSPLTRAKISDDKLAFGPQSVPPLTTRPPAPEARSLYDRIVHPRQPRPLAADEAAMHLQVFDATSPTMRRRGVLDWLYSQAASLIGSGALAPMVGEPYFRTVLTQKCLEQVLMNKLPDRQSAVMDQVASALLQARYEASPLPVSTPLLAVRACRRALRENPNDATTWFLLESAYTALTQVTREREFISRLPLLQSVRQVQRATALNHAVLIDPDHMGAHMELAGIFEQMSIPGQGGGGYYDLALHHRSEQLRILKERGRMVREKPEEYERRVQQLQDHVDKLDDFVRNAQTEYFNGEISRSTIKAKAELALSKGLGGQARDDMVKSLEVSVEPDAIPLQLNLMVMTGAIEGEKGIRVGLDSFKEQGEQSGKKPNMGRFGQEQFTVPVYEWLQVLTAASSGDYKVADEYLEPIAEIRQQVRDEFVRNRARSDGMYLLAAGLLDTQVTPMTLWRGFERHYRYESLKLIVSAPAHVADTYAIRGILALEAGDNAHAEAMFRKVLSLNEASLVPIAKYYLGLLEANK